MQQEKYNSRSHSHSIVEARGRMYGMYVCASVLYCICEEDATTVRETCVWQHRRLSYRRVYMRDVQCTRVCVCVCVCFVLTMIATKSIACSATFVCTAHQNRRPLRCLASSPSRKTWTVEAFVKHTGKRTLAATAAAASWFRSPSPSNGPTNCILIHTNCCWRHFFFVFSFALYLFCFVKFVFFSSVFIFVCSVCF